MSKGAGSGKGNAAQRRRSAIPDGNDASRPPKEPPTITSSSWEYDLGGGAGILPRFDVGKKSRRDQRHKTDLDAVAQRAVEQLKLPKPVIHTSPSVDKAQVVNVPTWMWLESSAWRPVSTVVSAGGVRVVATARPRQALWSMGDGGRVACHGPGTPYSRDRGGRMSSPDCGYTYRKASLAEPGRVYTVSVRVVWDVAWRGGGRSGTVHGRSVSADERLIVDEVQAVATRH